MGRSFIQLGLIGALTLTLTQVAACSGCSSRPARLVQDIDAPTSLPAQAILEPAALLEPVPGQGIPCAAALDCDDGNPCTEDLCVNAVCEMALLPIDLCCQSTPLQAFDFDDLEALDLLADAPYGGSGWGLSAQRAVSAPASLYFGDGATGSLGADQRVVGAVRLPPVTLPTVGESRLAMRLFVDIEPALHQELLVIYVDVLGPGGTATAQHPLASKVDLPVEAYAGFAWLELSLGEFAGETVQIRLDFDSVTPPNPNSEGVFVDDLEITTTCPETTDPHRDPLLGDDPATEDTDPAGDDTTTPEDPGSDDPNTGGSLVSGGSSADPCDAPDAHEGCCTADDQCDDGNPATLNVCEGAECVATWNPDACASDLDCDDGESCTLDACAGSLCTYEGTFGSLCCEEGTHPLADFDGESLQGLFVTDNLETGVFWRTDPTRSTTGDFSLYCGDPVDQTYAIGERVKSSATTPVLSLPAGGHTRLVFDLFMLTRAAPNVDVFQIFALRAGALIPVWSSKVLPAGLTTGFIPVHVDLASFAGQDVQLRFVFDSVDAHAPAIEGTYIDSLRLETTCF